MTRRQIVCVAGARPNFMKVAPILRALQGHRSLAGKLVHTGQHYDGNMSDAFLRDLELPPPAVHLGVGSGSHGRQTARIMESFEEVLPDLSADMVLVVGDVNSTIACALVAVKCGIPVGHVEAGLRSFDRAMPEEINRVLTDQISEALFVTEESGVANLRREGVPEARIHLTGNTMIDTLVRLLPRIDAARAWEPLGLAPGGYLVVTLHRPTNVDTPERLARLVDLLVEISAALPVVFPVHPRTRRNLAGFGLWDRLAVGPRVLVLDPQPYAEFLSLVKSSAGVLTDSGGIQEETTFLGIPCITQRTSTERPCTTEVGTNVLVGDDLERTRVEVRRILAGDAKRGAAPPLWDGHCAERIVALLEERFR
jgi:UDP-N-acetylglucosamine 2-epimerase (non-hydrolysing)